MKKCLTFNDHVTLKYQLKCMRSEIKDLENGIKSDTKKYLVNLPKKIFTSKKDPLTNQPAISNPLGKSIAKGINKTILKKEGFITKLIANLFLRQVGKKIENKLIK